MLMTGQDYLASLRDGRTIYVGSEEVRDVTTHPAFAPTARSFARIWHARADSRFRDALVSEEGGEHFATYYLMPRSREDLERRSRCSAAIAELSYGLLGRSPDFVAGYITGAAMQPERFDHEEHRFSGNVTRYFEHCRRNDLYLAHAVAPPQGTRDPAKFGRGAEAVPTLSVTGSYKGGVIVNGMKMLATGAAFAHELWIGNILPLAPDKRAASITCALPVNTPGLALWSRKTYATHAPNTFENPLSIHFDESDCVVVCRDVQVPWERIFTLDDVAWSRSIYFDTPAHTLSNHQSSVRYRVKVGLLLALAHRITDAMGTGKIPAVRDALNHLAAQDALIACLVQGQIQGFETLAGGFTCFDRRAMYASVYWATQNYDNICGRVRELMGGSVLQMPADASVLDDPSLAGIFERNWACADWDALDRMKLFRLAWDLLGTDFAGRHAQYERFYMGPAFVVREHVGRETAWDGVLAPLDELLASYDVGDEPDTIGVPSSLSAAPISTSGT
jgi:4-hydroxyphenylacetate 3-monooxygenase